MCSYRRREEFSPVAKKNSWFFEGPSTGVELNRVTSSTNIQTCRNCNAELEEEVENRNERVIVMEIFEKINIGIEEILRQL
jgi:hypothetical protein